MSYSVYFDASAGEKRLWHPLDLPELNRDQAVNAASCLSLALPMYHWAYGPTNEDGVYEIQ